jgi:FkbM family methyltransferase
VSERVTVGVATPGRRLSAIERAGRALASPLGPGVVRSAAARLLEATLGFATAGRGVKCRLPEGEIVRVLPRYRHASWNLDEYRAFREALRPGAIAFDVGASVGSYALLFGQWVRPNGRVYAFEPAPLVRAAFERHITLNALSNVVTSVPAAVADSTGRARFVAPGFHAINRLGDDSDRAALTVETITIDEFCARGNVRPDFIKVDVEGAELAMLRGARDTIRAGGDRLALFVEMHPSLWPDLGVTRDMIEAELALLRLKVEPITAGVDPWKLEGVAVRLRPV